jgi:glycosyltransferase involved in cell wall biosynthesis
VTGVERFAREVMVRLGGRLRVLRAPRWARRAPGHVWEQLVLPRSLHRDEVLWSPASSGPLAARNQVVTIHDISPIDHPEWFRSAFARGFGLQVPRLARRARLVLTSSRFSRERLIAVTGLPRERVVVVLPGVDGSRFQPPSRERTKAARRRYALPGEYLLAVGSRSPRKNLSVLDRAWRSMRRRHPRLGLVVVGEGTHTAPRDGLGDRPGSRSEDVDLRYLGRVPDADLPALYGGAAAFVYPSLYEGFGLPVLEAMACGTPVIASNRTGVPEAVGEAGLLVEPEDPDRLAMAIDEVLCHAERRVAMVARGLHRAAELSWERTATGVLETLTGRPS